MKAMHRLLFGLALTSASSGLFAQFPGMTLPPSGNNQKAAVIQYIGPVRIKLEYSSPAVHGPDGKDRRGQIWGKLVPYGLTNLGFGSGKPGPWRAGANENTVFETSHPVTINGKMLPAGRYGLHMIAGAEDWTLIFSKNDASWGSFFYEESADALRVTVKPHKHDYREWLTYEFLTRKPREASLEMQWEDLAVGWTIQVSNVNEIYLTALRKELGNTPGFSWQGYLAAVQFCLQEKTNLEEALTWAEAAVSMPFVGQVNFNTLSTKAQVLRQLNRVDEAKKVMQTAIEHPSTTAFEIHRYGRQVLSAGNNQYALEVFLTNQKRNGDAWPVHVGLARGYQPVGDLKQALSHAQLALKQAPDELNRTTLEDLVKTLSADLKAKP